MLECNQAYLVILNIHSALQQQVKIINKSQSINVKLSYIHSRYQSKNDIFSPFSFQTSQHVEDIYIIMKLWKIFAVIAFIAGYYFLSTTRIVQQDPMEKMNQSTAPILEELVQTKYFRLIRLNINQECPLGIFKKLCKSSSCSVCRCTDKDIPQFWSSTDKVLTHSKGRDLWSPERQNVQGWVWHVEDESNDQGEYFDVHSNIQSYTNYNGTQIWKLIYEENCFGQDYEQLCEEERILYNLISGLHTSISTHLSRFYKNSSQHSIWADLRVNNDQFHFNHQEYKRRVLEHPDRIKNLFLVYRILAKAVKQTGDYLVNNFTLQSDNITDDLKSKNLVLQLVRNLKAYDLNQREKESLSFFTQGNPKVRQYQKYIHNISNILNCVQCEKCRLFGKMQTYGIGTALKILLGYPKPYKRNQIVALLNVFNKVAMSIDTYYKNRQQLIDIGYEQPNNLFLQIYLYLGTFLSLFIFGNRQEQKSVEAEISQQGNKGKTQ